MRCELWNRNIFYTKHRLHRYSSRNVSVDKIVETFVSKPSKETEECICIASKFCNLKLYIFESVIVVAVSFVHNVDCYFVTLLLCTVCY